MFSSGWLVIISWNSKSLWLQLSQKTWYVDPWNPKRGSCCWSIVVQFGTRTKSVKELWLPQITTDSSEMLYNPFLPKQTIHKQKMQILLTVVLPKRATNWGPTRSLSIRGDKCPVSSFFGRFCHHLWVVVGGSCGKGCRGCGSLRPVEWGSETRWRDRNRRALKMWSAYIHVHVQAKLNYLCALHSPKSMSGGVFWRQKTLCDASFLNSHKPDRLHFNIERQLQIQFVVVAKVHKRIFEEFDCEIQICMSFEI